MMRAPELAQELEISMRTFYRRLKNGEIEGVETLGGMRYQIADSARPTPQMSAIRRAPQSATIVQVHENTRLQAKVETLEAQVELLTQRLDALSQWSSLAEARLSRRR